MSDSDGESQNASSPVLATSSKAHARTLGGFRNGGVVRGRGRGRGAARGKQSTTPARPTVDTPTSVDDDQDASSSKARAAPTLEDLAYGSAELQSGSEDSTEEAQQHKQADAGAASSSDDEEEHAGGERRRRQRSGNDSSEDEDEPSDEEARERAHWRKVAAMPATHLLEAAQRGFTSQLLKSLEVSDADERAIMAAIAEDVDAAEDSAGAGGAGAGAGAGAAAENGSSSARTPASARRSRISNPDDSGAGGAGAAAASGQEEAAADADEAAALDSAAVALADPDTASHVLRLRAFEAKLKRREAELKAKEADLSAKEAQIAQMDARQKLLHKLRSDLDARQAELAKRERSLAAKEKSFEATLAAALVNERGKVDAMMAEAGALVDRLKHEFDERDARMKEAETKLAPRLAMLAAREAQVTRDCERQLAAVAEKEAEVAAMMVAARDAVASLPRAAYMEQQQHHARSPGAKGGAGAEGSADNTAAKVMDPIALERILADKQAILALSTVILANKDGVPGAAVPASSASTGTGTAGATETGGISTPGLRAAPRPPAYGNLDAASPLRSAGHSGAPSSSFASHISPRSYGLSLPRSAPAAAATAAGFGSPQSAGLSSAAYPGAHLMRSPPTVALLHGSFSTASPSGSGARR